MGLAVVREEATWRNINTKPVKVEGEKGQTFEKEEAVILSSEAKVLSKELPGPEKI